MGLIKCPDCGKEFSDRATACPNCGCPADAILLGIDSKEDNTTSIDESIVEERYIGGYSCDADIANEIDRLLYDGKKMDAIKIFRSYIGEQDLKICKEAIEKRIKELGIVNQEVASVNPQKSTSKCDKKISENNSKIDSFSILLAVFSLLTFFIPFVGFVISVLAIVREKNNSKKNNRKISKVVYVYIFAALLSILVTLIVISSSSSSDKNNASSSEYQYEDKSDDNTTNGVLNSPIQIDSSGKNVIVNGSEEYPLYQLAELQSLMNENEVRFQEEFNGKSIAVEGFIQSIETVNNYNSQYKYTIVLCNHNIGDSYLNDIAAIYVYFEESFKEDLLKLNERDSILVIGKIDSDNIMPGIHFGTDMLFYFE